MFIVFQFVFLAVGLQAGSAVLSAACSWSDALSKNGKCFKYVEEIHTFQEARKYCESIPGGGMLAKFDSDDDRFKLDLSIIGDNPFYWIGANAIDNDGKFQWTDGSEAALTGLSQILPLFPDVQSDCISINVFTQELTNLNCEYPLPFMCMENLNAEVQTSDPLPVPTIIPPPTCTQVVDLIYVLDSSSSIGQTNFQKQISFAIDLASNLTIGQKDVRVGAVVFSFDPVNYFDLKDHLSFSDVSEALIAIPYKGFKTRTYIALDFIIDDEMFSAAAGSRNNSLKTVIVFTDGRSDNLSKTQQAAERIREHRITIYAVGIGDAVDSELSAIASSARNVFKADNVDALRQIVTSVTQEACPSPVK